MLTVSNTPRVRLTAQPANDFVDNRLSAVDPHFARQINTLPNVPDTYILSVPTKQDEAIGPDHGFEAMLQSQSQHFLSAVAAYGQSRNGKGSGAINLIESSSWADVVAQAEKAQREYEGAVKTGFLGNLRGRFRGFGEFAAPVDSWLKLLPSQSWQGSLICGGVLIALKVRKSPTRIGTAAPVHLLTSKGRLPPRSHPRRHLRRTREHTRID